jgi:hypothetical protein
MLCVCANVGGLAQREGAVLMRINVAVALR